MLNMNVKRAVVIMGRHGLLGDGLSYDLRPLLLKSIAGEPVCQVRLAICQQGL